MKYTINRTNHKEFDFYEINKRAGRAYFIPYSSKEVLEKTPIASERFSSDIVKVLSGEWDFKYYAKKSKLPEIFDTETEGFDKINVPSTWQRTGYEPPVYLNCPYEFETRPPKLPNEFSAGVYRKYFSLSSLEKVYILTFLGVIPCVDLYVNGKFAGYSEGAHNTAEFDISDYVIAGENELLAVVHKWSTGTFLECQDMFRENGIFRDVLLYEMPKTFINDYFLKTEKIESGWSINARISLSGNFDGYSVTVEIKDNGKTIAIKSSPASETVAIGFEGLQVKEWNAEIPKIYETYIVLKKGDSEIETVRNLTGFKQIKIIKNVFTFNDAKIKIKGVNHHDTHYKNGYVMSFADLEKDIKLMKSLNVNGVRTSHYPPDANLLTLCDLYGLYVIDEADIETHGCGGYPYFKMNLISNNPKWIPRYLDRVSRMYYRDRNHACITMWSLGNEAGGYKCQDACFEFLHEKCPEIPVHYEGVIRTTRHSYDVVSEMYTSTGNLIEVRDGIRGKKYKNKPFYLCEYCHAMGVGPGCLEEYWDIFYSADIFMGGCIWEWADHAVYHDEGKLKYTYGGDHGEIKHDGNFCVDGLMYPDRTPHTGALEMKAVYRPVRVQLTKQGSFIFKNTNRFRNADYITVKWVLLQNGVKADTGSFGLDIEPCGEQEIKLNLKFSENCDFHINFCYLNEFKQELATEQLTLREAACDEVNMKDDISLICETDNDLLKINFNKGFAVFSKTTGNLEQYNINGKEMMNQEPVASKGFLPNIFRALLDNDNRRKSNWLKLSYNNYNVRLDKFDFADKDGFITVNSKLIIYNSKTDLFSVNLAYLINSNGSVKVVAKLEPQKTMFLETDLPRFGLMLEMPRSFDNIEYYGLGERENLCDFKAQATIGIYKNTVDRMHEPYIKPQDNGNHTEVRWLKITDTDGAGIMFCCSKNKFSFSVHNYTQRLLQEAKHQEDLCDQNTTVLNIDGFMRGAGTASCGPDTLPKYTFDAKDGLEFEFIMTPVV